MADDDFSRITIRLNDEELPRFRSLMEQVRSDAGYAVPATVVVKSLMGFKTKLKEDLGDEHRAILKKPPTSAKKAAHP